MSNTPAESKSMADECERRLKVLEANRGAFSEEEFKTEKKKILSILSCAPNPTAETDSSLNKTVAEHFIQETHKQLYPWFANKRMAKCRQEEIEANFQKANNWSALKEEFQSHARNKQLPPLVVLVGHYLLYADDLESARYILMYMLLHFTTQECVETHNWYIAGLWDEGSVVSRGEQIAELNYPLFPAALRELNNALLRAQQTAATKMTGGGEDPVKAFFRKMDEDILHGGSYIPVYDEQGKQVGVGDLSELERQLNGFAEMTQSHIQKLNKQLREVKKPASHPPVYTQGYGSRGGSYGYGSRGRGSGRGGYRGNFRGGNAADDAEVDDERYAATKN